MKKLHFSINIILVFIFSLIVLYLTLLAGFSTSMMNSGEHTYLVSDSIALNIVSELAFLVIICVLSKIFLSYKQKKSLSADIQNKRMNKICCILLCTMAALATFFVLTTQRNARADQLSVQTIVNQWIDRNYSCFNQGGYLDRYPNQAGIILVCYVFSFIFGTQNFLAFQLVNVIALVLIYKEFGDIAEEKTGQIENRLAIYLFGLFFIPGIMYVGFVYGNFIGLALSLVSFKHSLLFVKQQKIKDGCITVVTIIGAVIIKQNYLIFGIALIVFLLIELVRKFQYKIVVFIVLLILVLASSGIVINELVFCTTGNRMSKGLSKWSWVTMGLLENKSLYDGWFNNYNNDTYTESEFDTDKQEEINKKDLIDRLRTFKNDPQYAIRFFAGKNASQWNNPGFQDVWVNQVMPKNAVLRQPPWVNYLINDNGTGVVAKLSNYLHFIILVGALFHVFAGGMKKNEYELFFVLAFIGGFVFHTIWEAKGQYTISYFWLLLPLSAEGHIEITKKLLSLAQRPVRMVCSKALVGTGITLFSVLALLLLTNTSLFRDTILRDEDTSSFSEYVASNKTYILQEADYVLHPKQDSSLVLSITSEEDVSSALKFEKRELQSVAVVHIYSSAFGEYQFIEFVDTKYALDIPANKNEVGVEIWAYEKNATAAQRWEFKRKNENEYVIYHNGLVLTYCIEENRVYLDNYNGSDQQKWIVDTYKNID